jgi:hypothetical protein
VTNLREPGNLPAQLARSDLGQRFVDSTAGCARLLLMAIFLSDLLSRGRYPRGFRFLVSPNPPAQAAGAYRYRLFSPQPVKRREMAPMARLRGDHVHRGRPVLSGSEAGLCRCAVRKDSSKGETIECLRLTGRD